MSEFNKHNLFVSLQLDLPGAKKNVNEMEEDKIDFIRHTAQISVCFCLLYTYFVIYILNCNKVSFSYSVN